MKRDGDEYEWMLNSGKCKETRQSQWPLGVRRRSAAVRLVRLWVRILPRVWMFVLCFARYGSLRRADHSARGVLPTVVIRV